MSVVHRMDDVVPCEVSGMSSGVNRPEAATVAFLTTQLTTMGVEVCMYVF